LMFSTMKFEPLKVLSWKLRNSWWNSATLTSNHVPLYFMPSSQASLISGSNSSWEMFDATQPTGWAPVCGQTAPGTATPNEFNEIWVYGSLVSGARTAEQTAAARFWTANVIRQYNRLGRDLSTHRSLDLLQTARLLAMLNVVGADAQIAVMHWKYAYLFWRPVTAIDPFAVSNDSFGPVPGFVDGNAATAEETGWRPLVGTPNHPEYPAAHGSITSAVAEVLTAFRGTGQIDVDIRGFDPSGALGNLSATRHFDTAAQLREEIVNARVWAGVHYRGSGEAGVDLGRSVAAYGLGRAFRPVK